MNRACSDFRRLLGQALEGAAAQDLTRLGWHEHLLACEACREVLAAEEALEGLLASLPEPKLPGPLARRVVRRLRVTFSDARLDDLLELDPEPAVPAGLAARVLAGVSRTSAGLDDLLEHDRNIEVPAGLATRVVARVKAEEAPRARFRIRPVPVWGRAAAAVLLASFAVFGAMRLTRGGPDAELAQAPTPVGPTESGTEPFEPSGELLDALAVLENWDLLNEIDPVALDAITVFGPEDELFRELSEDG